MGDRQSINIENIVNIQSDDLGLPQFTDQLLSLISNKNLCQDFTITALATLNVLNRFIENFLPCSEINLRRGKIYNSNDI